MIKQKEVYFSFLLLLSSKTANNITHGDKTIMVEGTRQNCTPKILRRLL